MACLALDLRPSTWRVISMSNWGAMAMMLICTAATIYDPARMEAAESILMAQYLALSALVGAFAVWLGHEK